MTLLSVLAVLVVAVLAVVETAVAMPFAPGLVEEAAERLVVPNQVLSAYPELHQLSEA